MATVAVQPLLYFHAQQLLNSWAGPGGPSEDEKLAFTEAAILEFEDGEMVKKFIENVKRVADWANAVDAAFEKVTRNLAYLVSKYGKDFAKMGNFDEEWVRYNRRWVEYLQVSRDVASEHSGILMRFEHVFIDMIMNIRTDQDRLDCIVELQQFIDEDHHRSGEMQTNFWDLRKDIIDFVNRFDAYVVESGIALDADAAKLKVEIDRLVGEIDQLDAKINDATIALAVMGGCLLILGVIIAGSIVAAFQSERNEKATKLVKKQLALAEITRKEVALGQLKYDFDNLKPDITLICEKLGMFATIWASVKSQSIHFQDQLKAGMAALTNYRFKKEMELARAICTPLRDGLDRYATELIVRGERNVGAEMA